ncbi:MAG: DNA-protecting protein DprA [Clostridia bacterium]|nr:DNA-protecting protein DprA [Clostridia bacterium]
MIIEYYDKLYPESLRKIDKPPSRLYVLGDYKILNQMGIAVIGSRTNTQYGENMCKRFTKNLVEYNLNIISGLAVGIDGIAHKTCLQNSGKTIAVLPSGLENIYPNKHKELVKEIINSGGAIVTEYEANVKADSKKFLERNRIVAGLGVGTLVIEAGNRSGTSVTAKLTSMQGKPVFCIPSSLENNKGKITNELIKKGANLTTDINDILSCYPDIKFYKKKIVKKEVIIDIPQELLNVYKTINDNPKNVNEIAKESNLSISEVNYKITLLQINNAIIELPGQKYVRRTDEIE